MFSSKSLRFCLFLSALLLAILLLPTIALAVVPHTAITINPARPDGYFGWYRTTPTITLTSDQPGTTYYQWDSTGGSWTTYTGPFSALVGDYDLNIYHTLYYYSISGADTEQFKFFRFKVDPTLPLRVVGGTCEGCHGPGSYKDQVSFLTGTSHDLPTDPIQAPDRCQRCHVAQMSAPGEYPPSPFLRDIIYNYPTGLPYTIMAENTNRLCSDEAGACHQNPIANSAYPGKNIYALTKHSIVGSSGKALTRWPDKNYGFGMCGNCHDPHGVEDSSNPGTGISDYRNASANNLCSKCHDDPLAPPKPPGYLYRGLASYNLAEHSSSTNIYTKWPNANDTGGGVPVGGSGANSGECINCHNPHGKDDGAGNPLSKLTMASEENLCYGGGVGACHSASTGSQNGINILERLSYYPVASTTYPVYTGNYTAHHDIALSDQLSSGGKVECKNCHNPHLDNRTNKMVDPDNLTASYTAPTPDPFGYSSVVIKGTASTRDTKIKMGSTVNQEITPNRYLMVGKRFYQLQWETWRTLIRFDLSAIPPGATIDQTTLLLSRVPTNLGDIPLKVHRLLEGWTESGATWYKRDGVNNWQTAGGTYDPTSALSITLIYLYTYSQPESLDVTNLVSQWYNGTYPNYGMILIAPDYFRSYESSEGLAVQIPSLVVRYYYPNNPPSNVLDKGGFCLKCHDETLPSEVTMPLGLKKIDPPYLNPVYGELHGAKVSRGPQDSTSYLKAPYYAGMPALPCTECHDPHGSSNIYHLKENINGQVVTVQNISGPTIRTFCRACHEMTTLHHSYATIYQDCFRCHYHRGQLEADLASSDLF